MGTLRSSVVALAVLVGAFVATVSAAADEGNGPGAYRPYYPGIWQGLYGGVNVGWGGSGDASGVGGGGQIGYNWQSNQYICGLEGDISAADIGISETIVVPGAVLNASASIDWIATIRGRVGVLRPTTPLDLRHGWSCHCQCGSSWQCQRFWFSTVECPRKYHRDWARLRSWGRGASSPGQCPRAWNTWSLASPTESVILGSYALA